MQKCIELALKGIKEVAPNPMVGCIIVHENKIIGKGYHEKYGEAHAEINAINSVKNKNLLKEATLYVNLEPCSHYGLTPPCSLAIIQNKIPKVIIGTKDPFPKVSGGGIQMLKDAGIEVTTDILRSECESLNKRFFTFHLKKRPYIFLKWAQSADGYIDTERDYLTTKAYKFSNKETKLFSHQKRANEAAILIGTNTAIKDNPSLTVRLCEGENPLRLIIDRELKTPHSYHLYDNSTKTVFFTEKQAISSTDKTLFINIDFKRNIIKQMLAYLYENQQTSLIVEGGTQLLNSFIEANIWDEIHIETATEVFLKKGIKAPNFIEKNLTKEMIFNKNKLKIYKNKDNEY